MPRPALRDRLPRFAVIAALLALPAALACCNQVQAGDGDGDGDGGGDALTFATVNDFVYQLQDVNLTALGNSAFDLVVTDYSLDGTEDGRLTPAQLSTLKSSPGGDKLVLAYMSIGEAESYRWYWQAAWDAGGDGTPDAGAPSWLGPSNPDWEGNYKVRYWDPAWRSIIFGSDDSYLDKIIDAGFDGVYLDIIDAYEYWGPDGDSGLNRESAEDEMVAFVKAIATYARTTKGHADFAVFPQNGDGLAEHADYVAAVTGIGREDLWYSDNDANPAADVNEGIANLDTFREAGKVVLVIDYVTQSSLIDDFYAKAAAKGYVPYATTRDLDTLTVNAGHEPD
jgi:cysteinyl-tRNA synthetase, unknown class